jgi:hypothetical protein
LGVGEGRAGASKLTALYVLLTYFSHQAAGGTADVTVIATAHIVDSNAFSWQPQRSGGCSWVGGGGVWKGGEVCQMHKP